MKIYTRTGDDGSTGLLGGLRVGKDDLRVEAYGSVDELNSVLGWTAVACTIPELHQTLVILQNRLFELGADLATPKLSNEMENQQVSVSRIGSEQVTQIEQLIDQHSQPLPALGQFILPGGSELAARLHLARTVCRRAERCCVRLSRHESTGPYSIIYLNRVSDLLFVMARRANQLQNVSDIPWTPPAKR